MKITGAALLPYRIWLFVQSDGMRLDLCKYEDPHYENIYSSALVYTKSDVINQLKQWYLGADNGDEQFKLALTIGFVLQCEFIMDRIINDEDRVNHWLDNNL
jgi:hypothetical protein